MKIDEIFDTTVAENNESKVRIARAENLTDVIGDFVAADFSNHFRALFVRHLPQGSTAGWLQVGPGWDLQAPPSIVVCDATSALPGCKPIVVVHSEFDRCTNGRSQYSIEFLLPPKSRSADSFDNQRRVGAICLPFWPYYCASTAWEDAASVSEADFETYGLYVTVSEDATFRSRGVNNYGAGNWSEFSLVDTCGNADGPIVEIHPD
jgi:hypothetical protein